MTWLLSSPFSLFVMATVAAHAQDPGTLNPEPLPPLANPNSPPTPARELFARKTPPTPGVARPIGSYANSSLAGAVALPITNPTSQVMRLSRNRYWGNPAPGALRMTMHAW